MSAAAPKTRARRGGMRHIATVAGWLLALASAVAAAADALPDGVPAQAPPRAGTPAHDDSASRAPSEPRQRQLLRMVRQDCGSCHGMRLTGGLGPPLTTQAMAPWPIESLAATIYHGRPGTPMPGWKAMITEAEADWIAARLQQGLAPDEGMSR